MKTVVVAPPTAETRTPPGLNRPATQGGRVLWWPLLAGVAGLAAIVMVAVIFLQPETERWKRWLLPHIDDIFHAAHPIGEATGLKVTAVGHRHTPDRDLTDVSFTLFWRGPITIDGYSKMRLTLDDDSQAVVDLQVLATNGITNVDLAKSLGDSLEEFFK